MLLLPTAAPATRSLPLANVDTPLTRSLLKIAFRDLWSEDHHRITSFEKIDDDFTGYFDVACSNIPFGDFAVADPKFATSKEIAYRQATKAIHNFFFLKALDQVREG